MADYYFTTDELSLIEKINFSKEVFEILKRAIVAELRNLKNVIPERFAEHIIAKYPHEIMPLFRNLPHSFDDRESEIIGITIEGGVVGNLSLFIDHLNMNINPLGYQSFLTVSSTGACTNDNVSIISGTDKFLLTEFIKLSSFGKKYTNEKQIIERLKKLDSDFEIAFLGVGRDWLKISVRQLPEDIDQFMERIREIAPDTFTWWGKETEVEAYEREVRDFKKDQIISLWWED